MKTTNFPRTRGVFAARADAGALKATIDALNGTVEQFRNSVDERLKQLEKGREDVVTNEKVERINADVGLLTKAVEDTKASIDALKIGGGGQLGNPAAAQHRDAFLNWMRRGAEPDAGMRSLEVKAALTTDSDPDGGYLVPEQTDSTISRVLMRVSAMRSMARVIRTGGGPFSLLVNQGGAGAGWVAEKDARPETATPKLSALTPPNGELYANPAATQRSLDDAAFNVETWLADEIAVVFAEQEGAAFITGDGTEKPRGILAYPTVANASYAWGSVGFVVSGAASAFLTPTTTASPADAIADLYYALRAGYRDGASFLTSDATLGTIRKFKDGNGTWLWAPPTADMPATILGKPVMTDDNMPAVAANAFPVAFGNFSRGYLINDIGSTRVLRDPYTNKPYVMFYTTKRVGGGITNFEAIKLLRIST